MNKQEFLEEINRLHLSNIFGLITFKTEDVSDSNAIFFQYFASTKISLRKFINFNFKLFNIKKISKIETTKHGCVIAYVER